MIAAGVVVFVALALTPTSAAQVSFVPATPLTLDFDELARDAGRIKVMVRNDSPEDQRVEVKLVGLAASADSENPNLGLIGPSGKVSKEIATGKTGELVLLLNTNARPNPGSYQATLIAAGSSGDQNTRSTTLEVTAPATPSTSTSEDAPQLDPQTITDFSVEGTNFVPSFITPTPALLLGGGLLLFLTLVPFVFFTSKWRAGLVSILAFVGMPLFVVGLLWSFSGGDEYYGGPRVSAVQVNPLPVGPDADRGDVGTLVAKDGSTAQATVSTGELRVEDVPRAGAYSGQIDLLKGLDTGAAKMTANVRDFWPFAFVVIGLGVWVGYLVTKYFTRIRKNERIGIDSDQLREGVLEDEARFSDQVRPGLYKNYSFRRLFDARLKVIRELLGNDEPSDTEEAKKKLEALRTYSDQVAGLWGKLIGLDASLRAIKAIANEELGVQEPIFAVQAALNSLRKPLDDGLSLDEDGKGLEDCRAELSTAVQSIATFLNYLGPVREYRRMAADKRTDEAHETQLRDLRRDLLAAARTLVTAPDDATMKTASTQAYTTWRAIAELPEVRQPEEWIEIKVLEDWLIGEAGAMNLLRDEGLLTVPNPDPPSATITVAIARPDGDAPGAKGDRDDTFVFTAKVKLPADLTPTATLRWDFGDRTHFDSFDLLSVRDETTLSLTALHRYAGDGNFTVRLYDDNTGLVAGETNVEVVAGPTKLERRRERFALNERRMTLASGVLAVFSGLVALYATSPTWGSPGDYLKALLWGTVVSEGVKQVTALVARTGPAS
jgi:hypothetical protein